MSTITIPSESRSAKKLVAIPASIYEKFLGWQKKQKLSKNKQNIKQDYFSSKKTQQRLTRLQKLSKKVDIKKMPNLDKQM